MRFGIIVQNLSTSSHPINSLFCSILPNYSTDDYDAAVTISVSNLVRETHKTTPFIVSPDTQKTLWHEYSILPLILIADLSMNVYF